MSGLAALTPTERGGRAREGAGASSECGGCAPGATTRKAAAGLANGSVKDGMVWSGEGQVAGQSTVTANPPSGAEPLGLYIHIPFCARKCPYCDFNTYAGLESLYEAYTEALCREMGWWATRLDGRPVDTVFLGGGTPTALGSSQLAQILSLVHDRFALAADAEISSEANPGIEDRGQFSLLRRLGVNRLSMGVQSFQADELAFLGRIHDADEALRAYDAATEAGFANINLDFMFGLPGQSVQAWNDTLEKALALAPRHLSLYSLIVEPDTPLAHWVSTGKTVAPDDDIAAEMYETAMAGLLSAGYDQYEVSNWSRGAGYACRHNLLYWRNQEWIGVGPGAHSHMRCPVSLRGESMPGLSFLSGGGSQEGEEAGSPAAAIRWANRKGVQGYIRRVETGESPVGFQEALPAEVSMGETMMLGLRLVEEGVPYSRFKAMHGQSLGAAFGPALARLQESGLLESDGKRVRLTSRGLLVGDRVFSEFIA